MESYIFYNLKSVHSIEEHSVQVGQSKSIVASLPMGNGGGLASRRQVLPAIREPTVVLRPQQVTDMCTTHRMGRDGHCQQFDITPTLISAPQWPHKPCNASIWLYTVGKKPSVKTDLAMYSHTVDVSRQCMSVSLILNCKLDFSSCAIRAGFRKSSHIYNLNYQSK